jgi:hypothetical protein
MSAGHQLAHTGGRQRDAIFAVLDFAGHCDAHGGFSLPW